MPHDINSSGWIQTYTGKAFYPMYPCAEDIDIVDIAQALSLICRFTGHVQKFYSVAQHSVLVSRYLTETGRSDLALWGLLHDASEAYLSDISRPVKHSRMMDGYRQAEANLQRVIMRRFGLPEAEPPEVKQADVAVMGAEARDLMGPLTRPEEWEWCTSQAWSMVIEPIAPSTARESFLKEFKRLFKQK
jgi:5'-deoxynucleotidase YfbR-like HD superfamily hydrolase